MPVPTILPPDDSQFEGLKYACYIRYMAPCGNGARPRPVGITSLIQNEKTLLCCFAITCIKRRSERDFTF
jgi:hypothetical protein